MIGTGRTRFVVALLVTLAGRAQPGEEEGAKQQKPSAVDIVDSIVLHHGTVVRGTLLDITREDVVIRSEKGTSYYPRKEVREIKRGADERAIRFFEKYKERATDEARWRQLASFCKSKGLFPEERQCLRRILSFDLSDAVARKRLGEVILKGRWIEERQVLGLRKQGFDIIDGKLVLVSPVKPSAAPTERPSEKSQREKNEAETEAKKVPPIERTPGEREAEALGRAAVELEKGGELEAALDTIQRAHHLAPEDATIERLVRQISSKIAKGKFDAAKVHIESGENSKAVELLIESYDLLPARSTSSQLAELGYTYHRGVWRTAPEIDVFEKEDAVREREAHEQLNLGPEFRVVRSAHFRVFTNMPKERQWDSWLAPVLKVMESHLEQYEWMFLGLIDTAASRPGLNVVFFRNARDYGRYVETNKIEFSFTTAGFYSPARQSSFFYRQEGHYSTWPTLVHELTHQFNDLLLRAARVTWINEGLAEYFGAARINKDYSLTIGRPHFESLIYLRGEGFLKKNFVSVAQLLSARGVDDPEVFPDQDVHQVYALMWGLVYFLLHNEEKHRQLIFEGIRRERELWDWRRRPREKGRKAREERRKRRRQKPTDIYKKLLAEYGFEIDGLDAIYEAFIRSVPMMQKKKS